MSSKIKVHKILVASGNQALVAPGTALNTGSTYNIANGQLGIFANGEGNLTKNRALGPGDDIYDAPGITIVQGTADVANLSSGISPLPIRNVESSVPISRVIKYSGVSYTAPTQSTWLIGRVDGNAGEINVLSETRYQLIIGVDGRRVDLLNGRNQPAFYPEFTTGNLINLGYTTELTQRNYLVQNLAAVINEESKFYPANPGGGEFVCLAIDEAGVGTGTAISALSAGNVTVGVDAKGNNIVVNFSADMVTSVQEAIVSGGGPLANTAKVIAYNAGSIVTANCDSLIVVAVDSPTGVFDRIPEVKSRLSIGLSEGFASTVYSAQVEEMFYGEGVGRTWKLFYESTDELRKFASEQYPSGDVIQYASPIAGTETFDAYVIEHIIPEEMTNGSESHASHVTIILNPIASTTTTASLEAVLNPWMISAGKTAVNL